MKAIIGVFLLISCNIYTQAQGIISAVTSYSMTENSGKFNKERIGYYYNNGTLTRTDLDLSNKHYYELEMYSSQYGEYGYEMDFKIREPDSKTMSYEKYMEKMMDIRKNGFFIRFTFDEKGGKVIAVTEQSYYTKITVRYFTEDGYLKYQQLFGNKSSVTNTSNDDYLDRLLKQPPLSKYETQVVQEYGSEYIRDITEDKEYTFLHYTTATGYLAVFFENKPSATSSFLFYTLPINKFDWLKEKLDNLFIYKGDNLWSNNQNKLNYLLQREEDKVLLTISF